MFPRVVLNVSSWKPSGAGMVPCRLTPWWRPHVTELLCLSVSKPEKWQRRAWKHAAVHLKPYKLFLTTHQFVSRKLPSVSPAAHPRTHTEEPDYKMYTRKRIQYTILCYSVCLLQLLCRGQRVEYEFTKPCDSPVFLCAKYYIVVELETVVDSLIRSFPLQPTCINHRRCILHHEGTLRTLIRNN